MYKVHIKKVFLFLGVCAFILFLGSWLFLTNEDIPGHKELDSFLVDSLVRFDPMPNLNDPRQRPENVIYVLGGAEDSLIYRFKTAAGLYRQGMAGRILVLSRPGMTEYDPSLKRNLTNDEWSFKRLASLGVRKEDIEAVPLGKGFFGTLSEARGISQFAINRGYNTLILVSSPYHTMRVWMSFSKSLNDNKVKMFIYPSNDYTDLPYLLLEYFKLIIYKNFILS